MQVEMFSEVPVVIGAYISKVTGAPVDVSAKLWVKGGSATEGAQEQAAGAEKGGVRDGEGSLITSPLCIEGMDD
jgi:hypothetical protein